MGHWCSKHIKPIFWFRSEFQKLWRQNLREKPKRTSEKSWSLAFGEEQKKHICALLHTFRLQYDCLERRWTFSSRNVKTCAHSKHAIYHLNGLAQIQYECQKGGSCQMCQFLAFLFQQLVPTCWKRHKNRIFAVSNWVLLRSECVGQMTTFDLVLSPRFAAFGQLPCRLFLSNKNSESTEKVTKRYIYRKRNYEHGIQIHIVQIEMTNPILGNSRAHKDHLSNKFIDGKEESLDMFAGSGTERTFDMSTHWLWKHSIGIGFSLCPGR